VLWMLVFRSAGAADNFVQLYSGILGQVLPGTTARKIDQRGPAVFVMIGDGAIRNHEYLSEVWKQSSVNGTPAESYEPVAGGPQAASPQSVESQPHTAPTPASESPRTIEAD
jgi:hypothetical protein